MPGPHFPGKAKHVIFLFLNGGPSQVDTFDSKPVLQKYHGKPMPTENPKTERKTGNLLRSPFAVPEVRAERPRGQRDFPQLGELHRRPLRDPLDVHRPAESRAVVVHDEHAGTSLPGRPSMGSWLTYGLGTENQNLPGYRRALSRPAGARAAAVELELSAGDLPGHVHHQ